MSGDLAAGRRKLEGGVIAGGVEVGHDLGGADFADFGHDGLLAAQRVGAAAIGAMAREHVGGGDGDEAVGGELVGDAAD